VQRLNGKVSAIPAPGSKGTWRDVCCALDQLSRGSCGYFGPRSHYVTDRAIESHLHDRVRNFLFRRRKMPARSIGPFSKEAMFGDLDMPRLRHLWRKGVLS
jgi:RNA-directed DNA polymerase